MSPGILLWAPFTGSLRKRTFDVGFFATEVPLIVYVTQSTYSLSRSLLLYMVHNNATQVCQFFTFKPSESLAFAIKFLEINSICTSPARWKDLVDEMVPLLAAELEERGIIVKRSYEVESGKWIYSALVTRFKWSFINSLDGEFTQIGHFVISLNFSCHI